MRGCWFFTLLCFLFSVTASDALANDLPAFPGAVGQGALSSGGRGGDVYHVENLDDYSAGEEPIPGSLRYGIESTEGPRTIVFDVSGAIELAETLTIEKSHLTIAGQTAPGTGVTLYGYPTQIGNATDVIIRHTRFRPGDFNAMAMAPDRTPLPGEGKGNEDLIGDVADAISILPNVDRIILDHISASWSMDETLSISNGQTNSNSWRNITVQHSIIGASLHDSFHHKGAHGLGSLNQGDLSAEEEAAGTGGYTHYGNLWIHQNKRTPSFGGQQALDPGQLESERGAVNMNVVNTVVYNWGIDPANRVPGGSARINYIGNYLVAGDDTEDPERAVHELGEGPTLLYHEGNYIDSDRDGEHNGISIDASEDATTAAFVNFEAGELLSAKDGVPFNFASFVSDAILPAPEAYERVVESVGASLWRDSVDEQLITELVERNGTFIDSQEELRDENGILPGIDDLIITRRPSDFDSDGDGMPKLFEETYGLSDLNRADGNATSIQNTGYTNLEVYLHSLTMDSVDGDLNLDGDVNENDYTQFISHFNGDLLPLAVSPVSMQLLGDTNADGVYSDEDVLAFRQAFDEVNGIGAFDSLAALPEPDAEALAMVAVLLFGLLQRKKRSRQ